MWMKVTVRATEALFFFDDSTHFHPSLSKICRPLWLPGISDWSVLFAAAADMTIILSGIGADVDNEPRKATGGRDNADFQILPKHVHWLLEQKRRVTEDGWRMGRDGWDQGVAVVSSL